MKFVKKKKKLYLYRVVQSAARLASIGALCNFEIVQFTISYEQYYKTIFNSIVVIHILETLSVPRRRLTAIQSLLKIFMYRAMYY